MMHTQISRRPALGGLCLVLALGCSQLPAPPPTSKVSPSSSGRLAIEEYDANHDGVLDESEWKKCPAIAVAIDRIDLDHNRQVTADEISQRVTKWLNSGTILMNATTLITLDGNPLDGALVTYDPEKFLGTALKPCEGTTDLHGTVSPKGPLERFPGVYLGFYRVRVSKKVNGVETIPARYNTESELGYEVADDIPNVQSSIEFHLKSK